MKPVLVVGHGLAGAILAQSLLMRGIRVHCVDAGIKHSASSVAAGLINPFIGPKLNIPEQRFLALSKERLISMNCWQSGNDIDINDKSVSAIIFAEGFNVIENPFFNWLPFAPAQGEILELHGPILPPVSNGTWLIPSADNNYLTGSTWKHSDLKSGPTLEGKKEIYRNLNFIPIEMFKEINHFSGIRSGTKDRNPILGKHPEHKNLFIFNGFGSRGSTTIMSNANRLINLLELEIELPEKVSLKR
ncbi:MAG: FAD-dependent oxidoreductase, partial [Opitutae bacterium]|nr:FAD-dependent oxidoreductase [Opitutae bacterium]